MDYWKDMYGKRTDDFINGVIAGIEAFAVWSGGKQVVGILKQPLRDAIKEVKRQLGGTE